MHSDLELVILSDTHGLHREVEVPAGDVLIHAGDFTHVSQRESSITDFNQWLGDLPHRYKLVVPGNHEYFLEENLCRRSQLSNATVLIDEGIEIEGLQVWGSPLTPSYGGAFGRSEANDRVKHWAGVPKVDILVTHGPAYSVLDRAPGQTEHIGDKELLQALGRIQPLLHVCGHAHGAYGQIRMGTTLSINAALMGLAGTITYKPAVVRIARRAR